MPSRSPAATLSSSGSGPATPPRSPSTEAAALVSLLSTVSTRTSRRIEAPRALRPRGGLRSYPSASAAPSAALAPPATSANRSMNVSDCQMGRPLWLREGAPPEVGAPPPPPPPDASGSCAGCCGRPPSPAAGVSLWPSLHACSRRSRALLPDTREWSPPTKSDTEAAKPTSPPPPPPPPPRTAPAIPAPGAEGGGDEKEPVPPDVEPAGPASFLPNGNSRPKKLAAAGLASLVASGSPMRLGCCCCGCCDSGD